MINALLLGIVAGSRSMTPLAAVTDAARHGALARDNPLTALLAHPIVALGLKAMAAGELVGDKLPSAPDRIIAPGIAARLVSGAIAGAAIAPRGQRGLAAFLAALTAVGAAHLTFDARIRAMRRYGQTSTGLVEDALVLAATRWIMARAAR